MAKVLILGNFELSLELEGAVTENFVRAQERRILRFLRKLSEEAPVENGTVERLEFEGFTYSANRAEPEGYYYNKTEPEPKAGES